MKDTEIFAPPIDSISKADKRSFLDISALIRSVQHVEGNAECFGTANENCDQVACAWRSYCLNRSQNQKGGEASLGKNCDPSEVNASE